MSTGFTSAALGLFLFGGILLIGMDVDYHRIFGITGTYALITGVLFGITGIGFWLDTRKAVKEDGYQPPAP